MAKKSVKTDSSEKKTSEKNVKKVDKSAVAKIPFKAFVKDENIMILNDKSFSKMYSFNDMNFVIETEEKQIDILENFSRLLNKFPADVDISFVIINHKTPKEELIRAFHLEDNGKDDNGVYRRDYNGIIDKKIEEGHNDIRKDKYVIINVHSKTFESAVSLFSTIDVELQESMQKITPSGVKVVSNVERAKLMAYICRGNGNVPFDKEWERYIKDDDFDAMALKKKGMSVKSLIAPDGISKESKKGFESLKLSDGRYCHTYLLRDLPQALDTRFLTEMSNIPTEMVTTVRFGSVPRKKTLQLVRNQNTAVKGDIYKATKSAAKEGIYDRDLAINESLEEMQDQTKELRHDVVVSGRKIFFATITSTILCESMEEMLEMKNAYNMKCEDFSLTANSLSGQQIGGLQSSLLTGGKYLPFDRMVTSDSACALFPFNIQEIMDKRGHFYGINSVSKNMIMYDRKRSDLPNGIILGRAGSGKSFIAKGEIIPNALDGEDDIIILDPDAEYVPIAEKFGGVVIDLETKGTYHINPMDMDMEWDNPKADPLAEKKDFMVSIVEAVLGDKRTCNSFEVSAIHRATGKTYAPYIKYMEELKDAGIKKSIDRDKCPVLNDFYRQLIADGTPEATKVAMSLEPYCTEEGSYNLFNHHTNVESQSKFLVYNLKRLPEKMKEMAMKVCLSNIWTRMCQNKDAGRFTWVYLDEFYLLCQTEGSATTLQTYFKRCRKYGCILTGITQDIEDLTSTIQGKGMLNNCGFFLFMKQSPIGRGIIQKSYSISDSLIDYIKDDRPVGTGVIKADKSIIPFNYRIPTDTELYTLMNTKME